MYRCRGLRWTPNCEIVQSLPALERVKGLFLLVCEAPKALGLQPPAIQQPAHVVQNFFDGLSRLGASVHCAHRALHRLAHGCFQVRPPAPIAVSAPAVGAHQLADPLSIHGFKTRGAPLGTGFIQLVFQGMHPLPGIFQVQGEIQYLGVLHKEIPAHPVHFLQE